MKDMIISEKTRKKTISEGIVNTTVPVKMAWGLSLVNFAERYNWTMNNADLDTAKKQG